jgi:hypothetical protein
MPPLTRSFGELVRKRIARDPAFTDALLCDGIDTCASGSVASASRPARR